MICNSDAPRRILTSPAILPCDSISPATLLASLISLSSKIIQFKSKPFFANKHNARETIRLIEVLSVFLEQIREKPSLNLYDLHIDTDSVILGLSEVYFVLQKVNFLLEDCTRDGVRMYMLINYERVADRFRVLMRALATALDVLPLGLVEGSVSMVSSQARKMKFEADFGDKIGCEKVILFLEQFENGVVPRTSDLREIVSQLGILTWSDCNREIKFLDLELEFEYSTSKRKDLGVLSGLIGLMSYCRAVLFDDVDNADNTRQSSCYPRDDVAVSCLNPDDFRCPISLEIMIDPVTVATGHTYDRCSISKWFKAGNVTCPKTGERVMNTDLIPNLALKKLIVKYCFENNIQVGEKPVKKDITRTVSPGSVAAGEAIKSLADFLKSKLEKGSAKERNKAAFEIRLLTKSSIFNRTCLVESGTVPPLLDLLHSSEALAQENASSALLNLSKHSESKNIMVENMGVEAILRVLRKGLKVESQQNAAGILFYLTSVEEYRVLIGETPGVIQALVDLVRDGTDRGKKNALVAIFGLLMYPDNHWRVLSTGLVPLLTNLLKQFERDDLITNSLAILAAIAEKKDGTSEILRAGALTSIVEIFSSTISKAGKEFCVSLLLSMCVHGEGDVVSVLVENHSLMDPLYALLTKGTSRASRKASLLIRLLHEHHERSFLNSSSPALLNGRFVHVW